MNSDWIQTLVMGLIFVSATLFAIKHFLPDVFANGWRLFTHKKNRTIDINPVVATSAASCQTKCSACNGCSMANK